MQYEHTNVDSTLLLEFFLTFARFEYALKVTSYLRQDRWGNAKPDWESFVNAISPKLNKERTISLKEACDYIFKNPPNEQVVRNGTLGWKPFHRNDGIVVLIKMVKCVRNNLFHGGKYRERVNGQTERTTMLLQKSLIILKECLFLAQDVEQEFKRTTI